jgi:hypothetical protein
MRMVMYSVCSLTYSYLIVSQSCERTYKFNWRSQSAIRSYKISFIEVKVECHVLLVVGVK